MELSFAKYHGALNDFIIVNNVNGHITTEQITKLIGLCDRRSGVGADGLLLMESSQNGYDYKMRFFNPDHTEAEFCGNGARCLFKFAYEEGIVNIKGNFIAGDGPHEAAFYEDNIEIKMGRVHEIPLSATVLNEFPDAGLYDSGVPHLVLAVEDVDNADLFTLARRFRPNEVLQPNGVNVNIFSVYGDQVNVRTFERGVEDETMACGTGNVAVAYHILKNDTKSRRELSLRTKGGTLTVAFNDGLEASPWLIGPAVKICNGSIEIS